MDPFFQDLRYAVRSLRRSPGFSLVVVLTLTLGIGANTAIFSVANAVMIRPLQAPDADRIVEFMSSGPAGSYPTVNLPTASAWVQQTTPVLEDVSAHRLDLVNLTGGSHPEQIAAARVTAAFFRLFGATVETGRTFTRDEDRPGGPRVVVLSHGVWLRRFGADAAILGTTIVLGTQPYQIIGVLSAGFDPEVFDQRPDVWVPFQIDPETRDSGGEFCAVAGRLKPGVTLDAARAQLQTVANDYRRAFPNRVAPRSTFTLVPVRDALVSNVRSLLALLGCAVGLVLLIASANVANLLLARGTDRRRELAIRASLGASRGRLVRQLLTESLVLSLTGSALGLVCGSFGIRALLAAYPGKNPLVLVDNAISIPRIGHDGSAVTIDWRVLMFTLVVALLTTVLFGLLPALRVSKTDLHDGLKRGASGGGIRHNRLRSLLVASELGLAVTLLVGAALLIRSVLALHAVNPGFDPHNVLTIRMSLSGTPFERRAGIADLTREGIRRLSALPGVTSASTTCCVPLETVWQLTFSIEGRPEPSRLAGWTFVSPGYFDVFRIPVLRGRAFTERDTADAPGVIIINEAMARRFWPTTDPLSDRLVVGRGVRPDYDVDPVRQIVGIVGDVRDTGLNRNPRPAMYVPVAQVPDGVTALNVKLLPIAWVVRTSGAPHSVAAAVEEELQKASGLATTRVRSMDEVASESTARTGFETLLMTVFAGAALVLSAIGVYGLMSYAVHQRTREIGIRMALGADQRQVRNMVMRHGTGVTLAGAAIGIAAAAALTRLMASFLFGVTARDPIVFVAAPVVLIAVSLTAAWLPSVRATHIEPAAALRHE